MKFKTALFSFVLLFTFVTSFLTPSVALADGEVPPTSEPALPETGDDTSDLPEVIPSPMEESPASETETVAEVVEILAEADAVLITEGGEALPLVTEQAAEVIEGSDPYFFNGVEWVGYSASGVCPAIVTTCNTSSTPFQAAINAASSGTTIYVEAGTYTEQLVIDHSLIIVGNGSLNTFIDAPAVLNTGTNGERSIITITGATTLVELSGFTVQGPGGGGCNSINYGIFVRDGANANIHDNVITDIRDDPLGGCQNGIAIGVGRAVYGTTGSATIEDNTIEDFQKGGIVVDNVGSDATITDNTISGIGPTSTIAQNGIQISRGATSEVTDNTISDLDYLVPSGGTAWTSAGILLYQPGTTLVDGNTISNSNVGIYDYQSTNTIISENTVSGSCSDEAGGTPCEHDGWGVYTYQSTNLELTDNTIVDNVIGVGVNNSTGTISGNLFDGNDTGMVNYGSSTVDATNNCWGSDSGPTNASNPGGTGDVAGGNILFDPWECTPASSTGNGSGSTTVSVPSTNIIPVTGGQRIPLGCEGSSSVLELNEVRVVFTGLCGYEVVIDMVNENALPAGIGDQNKLLNGMSITLLKGDQPVNIMPANASIQVSYIKTDASISVFEWSKGGWSQLVISNMDDRLLADLTLPNTFVVMVSE
jgi:parallel beta-helix repeat protein